MFTKSRLKTLSRHLIPNIGTLILLLLFFYVQSVGANPFKTLFSGPTDTHISYQGRLTAPDGQPLTGSYQMSFALYTSETGGTSFWSETYNSQAVSDGLLNVLLGSATPLPDPLPDGNLYLGITIGSEELTPRQPLSSGYHALGSTYAVHVPDGSIGTTQLAPDAVTTEKIADDAVTLDKIGLAKYRFGISGSSPSLIYYVGPTAQQTTLDVNTCSLDTWCCNAEDSICYYPRSSANSIVEFSLDGAPSIECVLLHVEDDFPSHSKGWHYATDGGNHCHMDNRCVRLSEDGVSGNPINSDATYSWLCGW